MSLILDALRRAEQDQRSGQVPSVYEPSGSDGREPKAVPWPMVFALSALLLLSLAVSTLVQRRPPLPEPTSTPHIAQATPKRLPQAESLDELMEPSRIRPAPPPLPQIESPPRPQKAPEPSPNTASLESTTQAPQPVAPPTVDSQQKAPQAAVVTAPKATPPGVDGSQEPNPLAQATSALVDGPAPTPLQEMPRDYRSDFPALTVDVHVYNDEARRRFTLINLKRYREGDTLAEGPKLIEIVPQGLIFDYRGQRVLFRLP